ncbi:M6 family metalloprotease-like protein [Melghirimyces profundicolus]|uniref:M6 family metalloprotease-like protein n=1 Tax=Melghirimyces profundicolus TaxID=1242148 RepID=A0A2T6BSU3_9BACL|nr:M6 family metalloprotease domain-containing protein [Melghirimyces profundicolus]PTX59106.1 M6 family metalloprotease-like protein [Melghirimyces profundicolus]
MKRHWISSLAVFSLLLGTVITGGWSAPGAGSAEAGKAPSYEGVSLPDEVVQEARKKGMNPATHQPAHLINGPHAENPNHTVDPQPIDPDQKVLAIYMDFPDADEPPTEVAYDHVPVDQLNDLLFGDTYNPYEMEQFKKYAEYNGQAAPTDRTMKNFYQEMSYGKVNVSGEVVKVKMPHPYSYYKIGQPYGTVQNDYGDYTMALLLEDAVAAADPVVDFSRYAVDGEVPNVFFIHEGTGAEWNLDPRVIWSHKWEYNEAAYYNEWARTGEEPTFDPDNKLEVDGVKVNTYSVEPEVGGDITGYLGEVEGPFPPQVGVYAHEFGHVLGLPDLYDYGYDSEGVGAYSLMSGGSWTRYPNATPYSGNSPVHPDAWSKIFIGMEKAQTLTEGSKTFTLQPSATDPGVVKLVVPDSEGSEYFLIENRQPVDGSFDKGLTRYGDVKGLAIYHVDENVLKRNFWRPNEAQNWFQSRKQGVKPDPRTGETHYAVSVLQADNRWDLEKNHNRADEGDLYQPGDVFSPTSTPNSGSYYFDNGNGQSPNYTGIFVKDIVQNEDGSVTFTAGFEK